jgi:hypothetical protein
MSAPCPPGQSAETDRTAFGSCMDAVRTLDPTRPDPTQDRFGGTGLSPFAQSNRYSPTPFPAQRDVWHHLTAGLATLSLNDHGHPWPNPRRDVIAQLLGEHDDDLCIRAAREAREIVQSQDRAPNITALFAKKVAELAEVRSLVRESLEMAQ